MRVSSAAMKRILSDPILKTMMISGKHDKIEEQEGFKKTGKLIVLEEEGCHKVDLIDFRTIKGTPEQIEERFFECKREIEEHGNVFMKRFLSSHQNMVESRLNFTLEQKTGYRKMIIGAWHNAKVVFGIEVTLNDSGKKKPK